MPDLSQLLKDLNPAQLQAVRHPPHIPLQILAGPGSGKTKVLTMRVAYLIAHCYIPPSSICAVTFTNKAANEMRERLVKLIGKDQTAQIKMGTFHALCASFLRRYGRYAGIEGNFTVCDADESKKILKQLLKPFGEWLKGKNITLKEGSVQSIISKWKAKGLYADDVLDLVTENKKMSLEERAKRIVEDKGDFLGTELGELVATVYKGYEKTLREANSLDFDDLLLFGVKMFSRHKKASGWCQHILVDEYQDTNTTQYELMRYIAQKCKCVTIVGDPDQSIYGWRAAEIGNLANMQRDFPETQQVYLEQNYRSTKSILAASMAIISQDQDRIPKTLHTAHPVGPLPVLRAFPREHIEAGFMAAEIKRLVAFSGGMLKWGDFAILLRYNSMSRVIESMLQKEGIPNRVLSGHRFFERMEVKDILAYLQLVDNPAFLPAFNRVVNVPSRTVGDKTVRELLHRAEQLEISPLAVVERIVAGDIPDIKPPVKKKLATFVSIIDDLRKYANQGMSPSKLIQAVLEFTEYEDYLRKTQEDFDGRWGNVQELINFAAEVENNMPEAIGQMMADIEEAAYEELFGDGSFEHQANRAVKPSGESSPTGDTPLRLFLQASMLSTDTEVPEDDKSKGKVTISTCHAAKGLEWAVVMIPGVENGVFPSARSEDVMEELRLLYVACTRAQCLLYLSHANVRMVAGEDKAASLSRFVAHVRSHPETQGFLAEDLPSLPLQDRVTMSKILSRELPDDVEVARLVTEYEATSRHPIWGPNAPFGDDGSASLNGYEVPARYPAPQRQQLQDRHQEQCQSPQRHLGAQPSGFQEPPVFRPSRVVHLNNMRRDATVGVAQPTPNIASSSRATSKKPVLAKMPSSANRAGTEPLSSSNRIVNAPTARRGKPVSAGSDLRNWVEDFGKRQSTAFGRAHPPSDPKVKEKAVALSPNAQVVTRLSPKAAGKLPAHPPSASSGVRSCSSRSRVANASADRVPKHLSHSRTTAHEASAVSHTFQQKDSLGHRTASPGPSHALLHSQSSSADVQLRSSDYSLPSSMTSSPNGQVSAAATPPAKPTVPSKRRLGIGHATTGYTNKKFKPIVPSI